MSSARTPEEWDRPHILPDGIQDPFTIFACNERKIAWIRAHPHDYSELQVQAARREMDVALAAYHDHLVRALLDLTGEERSRWRDYVPQVEFWSSGEVFYRRGRRDVRHPAWPWDPEDAIGDSG